MNDPAVDRGKLRLGSRVFAWGARTFVMGVLNVTPDSFSGDGVANDAEALQARIDSLLEAAPDIIDVGGESTRPGAAAVPARNRRSTALVRRWRPCEGARPKCRFPSIHARPPWRAPRSTWAR